MSLALTSAPRSATLGTYHPLPVGPKAGPGLSEPVSPPVQCLPRRVTVTLNEQSRGRPGGMASSQSILAAGFSFYPGVFSAFSLNTIRFVTF